MTTVIYTAHNNISLSLPKGIDFSNIIFEFCCHPDSQMGIQAPKLGKHVIRLSLKVWDLLLDSAVPFLANLAFLFPGACVHGSLPCTAWSSYQRINCAKFGPSYCIARRGKS